MPRILYLQSTITSYKSQRDEQITIVSKLGESVVCRASLVRLYVIWQRYHIDIGKGVRQGCILAPLLFNIYAEKITREALDTWEGRIGIGGRVVTNLRYADDTTLIPGTKEDLIEIMESKENKRESRPTSKCPKYEGHDYRRYWR